MDKLMIIANPSSGQGNGEDIASYIQDELEKESIESFIKVTQSEEDIYKFANEAVENEVPRVFLIGGDGTISHFMNALKDVDNKPEVAIIPTGTMNNVARSLTISVDPYQAANQLINGKPFEADMGLINGDVFTSTISAGPVPESAWQISDEEKEQFGSLAYIVGGIKSMNQNKPYEYKLEIDGNEMEVNLDLLVIGVSNTIIGYTNFFQGASYNDHRLHLFGLKDATLLKKVFELSKLVSNNDNISDDPEGKEHSFIDDFEEIKIDLVNEDTHLTVDGNKGPSFPVHIKVLPNFVTLIVPENL